MAGMASRGRIEIISRSRSSAKLPPVETLESVSLGGGDVGIAVAVGLSAASSGVAVRSGFRAVPAGGVGTTTSAPSLSAVRSGVLMGDGPAAASPVVSPIAASPLSSGAAASSLVPHAVNTAIASAVPSAASRGLRLSVRLAYSYLLTSSSHPMYPRRGGWRCFDVRASMRTISLYDATRTSWVRSGKGGETCLKPLSWEHGV